MKPGRSISPFRRAGLVALALLALVGSGAIYQLSSAPTAERECRFVYPVRGDSADLDIAY